MELILMGIGIHHLFSYYCEKEIDKYLSSFFEATKK